MTESSLLRELGQVSNAEVGEVFREFLSGSIVKMACEVMAAEVVELCGPKHAPSYGTTYRAGSPAVMRSFRPEPGVQEANCAVI